ncbi:unnamed protein product [Rotaria sp. Silwood1]|nr:unnamed protein product [Rotaria sp. Silwood1]CAF1510244.1 unnamed protein product [Rotaria sp. Silwood1]CAF3553070.1 unnamed protein product [Rotaria sp. Silwood1]CAF3631252.1 unnamed protein product [Rotaria sp. Silwood1]CAF3640954.1 unnamed protein product [Rotaria sp. Silwood1]
MSRDDNSSYEDTTVLPSEIAIPRLIRFWIILLVYIPSVICSLFIFYNFIVHGTLRQALHNHVIVLLLLINFIVQLTSIPWTLNYYRSGYVWPQNSIFCLTWSFIDEALYITTTILFSWATIERHLLIFHDHLLSTKYKLFFFHYLPVVIILLYCICYNTIVIIFPPCENTYDYSQLTCGDPLCYYEFVSAAMWDVILNDIIPTIIIICCSITLLLRVVYQKFRMHRQIRWRNHRKMTIQMLAISALYLVIYMPNMLLEFIHLCGITEEVGADFMLYAEFCEYYGHLLLPFVCAISMPELRRHIHKIIPYSRQQTRAVGPQVLTLSRHVVGPPLTARVIVS